MTEDHSRSHLQLGELNQRASSAASALLQKANTANAPDLRHLALARRLFLVAALGVLGLVLGAVLLVSFLASGALPWIVGSILVLTAVGVIILGLHAGGHGWFVPLPVLVLAGAWALTASAGGSALLRPPGCLPHWPSLARFWRRSSWYLPSPTGTPH